MNSIDSGSACRWAEEKHALLLQPGDRVIDATMGNGHDTLRLCKLVGPTGKVYAFDVQPEALRSTRERLESEGCEAELILDSHENLLDHVSDPVDLIVFNLGWLPGIEHAITTHVESTLKAVNASLTLLKPGGLMTVCVYPGHDEGKREEKALLEWAASLDPLLYDATLQRYLNIASEPPILISVQKAVTKRKPRKQH